MRACTAATARPAEDRPGSEPVPDYRLVARVGGRAAGILGEVAGVVDFLNEPRHQLEERSGVAIHHRAIRPQNARLIRQAVKVADFGLSCPDEPGGSARSQCGLTFVYAAPETGGVIAIAWGCQLQVPIQPQRTINPTTQSPFRVTSWPARRPRG
jgi:hypothetical protein